MNKFQNADELLDSVKNEGLVDLNEGAKIGTDSDNQLSAAIDILKNEE